MRLISIIAAPLMLISILNAEVAMSAERHPVALEWYGHSCFLITLQNGAKILIDPYDTTRLPYSLPQENVDLIFSTHDHFDHNAVKAVPSKYILQADGRASKFFGNAAGIRALADSSWEVDLKGNKLTCSTVPSFHDERKGSQRGANGMIRFSVEGLTFAHLGDIGDTLNADQIAKLRPVDVLLIPVGGYFTVDSTQAQKIVQQLQPRVVVPMHYKTDLLNEGFPISTADAFLQGYQYVNRNPGSAINLQAGKLPENLTIEVLKYHGQK